MLKLLEKIKWREESSLNNTTVRIYLLFCVLGGLLLRTYKWLNYSLWYDEMVWAFTSENVSSIRELSIFSLKPPLFNVFLLCWNRVASGEFFLRLPSVIFGLLAILLSYKITKILFNNKAGLIAAFIVAFSPFHIYYSQELNYYTITLFLSLSSMYFFIICLQKSKWHLWIIYSIVTTACIYTNYMCLFLLLAQSLFFLIFFSNEKLFLKKWLFSQGAILALLLPLASFFFGSISAAKNFEDIMYHWMPKGNLGDIIQTFNVFNLGYNSQKISRFIGMSIFLPLSLCGIWVNRKEKEKLFLLLFWLFIPIISSIAVAHFLHIYIYTHRNFFYASVPYYLLITSGLYKLPKKYLSSLLVIILFLFAGSLRNYYQNVFFTPEEIYRPGVHLKQDHRAATKYIVDNFKEGDTVIHICRSTYEPFFYYASFSEKKSIKELVRDYFVGKGHLIRNEGEINGFTEWCNRIWFVFSHWEPQSLDSPDSDERKIKLAFDHAYALLKSSEFDGIKVYLYNTKNGNR